MKETKKTTRKTTARTGSGKKSNHSAARKSSGKTGKQASGGRQTQHRRTAEEINTYRDQLAFETGITILVLCIVSMFFYLSFLGFGGRIGVLAAGCLFGILGWLAWLLPVFVLVGYVFAAANPGDRRVARKVISAGAFLLFLSALGELLFPREILTEYFTSNHVLHRDFLECLYLSLEDVAQSGRSGGGVFGRMIGDVLCTVLGRSGAAVVLFGLLLLCAYIFGGPELMASLRKRNARRAQMAEEYDRFVEETRDYREPSYRVLPKSRKVPERNASGSGLQAVDLQAAAQRLDILEEKEKQERMEEKQRKEQQKKEEKQRKKERESAAKAWEAAKPENQKNAPSLTVPSGLQEITAAPDERKPEERESEEPEMQEPEKAAAEQEESFAVSEEELRGEIPIYREELDQKFGAHRMCDDTDTQEKEQKTQKPEEKAWEEENMRRPAVEAAQSAQKQTDGATQKIADPERRGSGAVGGEQKKAGAAKEEERGKTNAAAKRPVSEKYQFPPVSLLDVPGKQEDGASDGELRKTAMRLKETLRSFHVDVQMGAVTCGPTVTRYEVLPAQGVRVNKITNLADDLKLSLAAPSIRIEAPIPGKAAVGIEVPNAKPGAVHFRELLEGKAFEKAKSPVAFAVGKDIAGKVIITDIAKMPHLLIAGATGSGKSVCINTLIMSILYKSDPDEVKLIMIDPKVVELSCYNGIPHLFCPVVTDPKEAAAALHWAVQEMMGRYNKFKELGVRNINGYNEKIKSVENPEEAGYAHMPLLVIIVDEFADLMMVASKEVEDAVCRLAQLARAAGIHLILATQRPSVNVITGVIKANIPSRIAFSVSSAIDSRTILDKGGAEKLLGKGDMLFFPSGYSEPVRLQGAFVSDQEVARVVEFLKSTNDTPEYDESVTEMTDLVIGVEEPAEDKKSDVDEYFEEAGRFVIESERAAAGQLQRRFSIGFNRAGRIIDQLNQAGVVGPAVGTKPRQVLMTMEQFEAYLGRETAESDMSQE